jgi:hypothetical protein
MNSMAIRLNKSQAAIVKKVIAAIVLAPMAVFVVPWVVIGFLLAGASKTLAWSIKQWF